ncbi:hypothetical protein GQ55_9G457100 [Panicum hallii var. hallii]|uniref:Uncharacterized protein n=1 Tax=Panicum hallii var. hallii TaxID=1504633 RepID=A0A2T7CC11_9POAL|nr:hypothetical protein GQ55_9G457100 [Panicum hallii var. hallii]
MGSAWALLRGYAPTSARGSMDEAATMKMQSEPRKGSFDPRRLGRRDAEGGGPGRCGGLVYLAQLGQNGGEAAALRGACRRRRRPHGRTAVMAADPWAEAGEGSSARGSGGPGSCGRRPVGSRLEQTKSGGGRQKLCSSKRGAAEDRNRDGDGHRSLSFATLNPCPRKIFGYKILFKPKPVGLTDTTDHSRVIRNL